MIENTVTWLIEIIEATGYLGIAFAILLESVFPPIPSAFILPFMGFVSSRTEQLLIVYIAVASVAAYIGTLPFYFLGVWGEDFLRKFLDKYGKYFFIEEEEVEKAFEFFDKKGNSIVFFGRLIPLIRSAISFPAGVARMPFIKYSIYTLLGSAVWSAGLGLAGYFLGEQWEIVVEWLARYEDIALILTVVLFLSYIGYKIYKKFLKRSKVSIISD